MPVKKTHSGFNVSESGTHRQSHFQCHFSVTRDETEKSNADLDIPGISDG